LNRFARKSRDGASPKMRRRDILLHHANFPHPREPPPHFLRHLSSNSESPASTNHKELRHIPDRVIARDFRPSLGQQLT
jgi:hypothetical protein